MKVLSDKSRRGKMKGNVYVKTAREAADFLRVHLGTIRRLAGHGCITAFKVGKDRRFHKEELGRWSNWQYFGPQGGGGAV